MKTPTLFVDVDGTLFLHKGQGASVQWFTEVKPVEGAVELLDELERRGWYVVLTTARKEQYRKGLVDWLEHHHMVYDQLVMGLPSGTRIVVNDTKGDGSACVGAIALQRNGPIDVTEVLRTLDRGLDDVKGASTWVATVPRKDAEATATSDLSTQADLIRQPRPASPGYYWYRPNSKLPWQAVLVDESPEDGGRLTVRMGIKVRWLDEIIGGTWGNRVEEPK